jgi:hypothetical protein
MHGASISTKKAEVWNKQKHGPIRRMDQEEARSKKNDGAEAGSKQEAFSNKKHEESGSMEQAEAWRRSMKQKHVAEAWSSTLEQKHGAGAWS